MRWFLFASLRAKSRQRPQPATFTAPIARLSLRSPLASNSFHASGKNAAHTSTNNNNDKKNLSLLNKSLYDASLKCSRLGWFARRNQLPSNREGSNNCLDKNPMKEFLMQEGIRFERYVYAHKYGYHHSQSCHDNKSIIGFPSQTKHGDRPPPSHLAIVHEKSPFEAARVTKILMEPESKSHTGHPIDTILQPTFLCGNRVARADVAVRRGSASSNNSAFSTNDDPWEILEIKSSTEKTFRKKIPDLAYTVFLARSTGYRIHKASLIVVNPAYVRENPKTAEEKDDDSYESNLLYKTIDCTELVNSYILDNNMEELSIAMDRITGEEKDDSNNNFSLPPPVEYKLACGKCELLGVECGPHDTSEHKATPTILPLKHGIWELPRLSQKQFPDLLERALPTLELQDLDLAPDESSLFLLTKTQLKFFHAVATRAVVVQRDALEKRLTNIANGGAVTMYLDFEAVSVLNPPYPGMTPYETMVTQYSLHKREEDVLSHSEYLSDPRKDCRKELLEHLLEDLGYGKSAKVGNCDSNGSSGPVLVYSSYEKTQLKRLAALFPEHSEAISDVIEHRLVDLEKIIKDCVSHPDFCGRSSIKVTLPALVPGFEQAYQDLLEGNRSDGESSNNSGSNGIADGGAASAAFAELISGVRSEALKVETTRTALLEYCKLDTLALVEIHKALWTLIQNHAGTRN